MDNFHTANIMKDTDNKDFIFQGYNRDIIILNISKSLANTKNQLVQWKHQYTKDDIIIRELWKFL